MGKLDGHLDAETCGSDKAKNRHHRLGRHRQVYTGSAARRAHWTQCNPPRCALLAPGLGRHPRRGLGNPRRGNRFAREVDHRWQLRAHDGTTSGARRHRSVSRFSASRMPVASVQEVAAIPRQVQAGHGARLPGESILGVRSVDMELSDTQPTSCHGAHQGPLSRHRDYRVPKPEGDRPVFGPSG
jgi:hypothetical protein